MKSTRLALLTVFSAVVAINAGFGQSPTDETGIQYRTPRSLSDLESEAAAGVPDEPARVWVSDAEEEPQETFQTGIAEPLDQFESIPEADEYAPDSEESGDESDLKPTLFASLPSMRSVSIDAPRSPGILPEDFAGTVFSSRSAEFQGGGFLRGGDYGALVNWCAPYLAYRPLYFEDVWLERHGYDYGHLQPFVSAAKFYGRIPLISYMVGATPCHECTYSLGLGRPGDCPPHFFTLPKRSRRGLLYQAACVTGTVLLTP